MTITIGEPSDALLGIAWASLSATIFSDWFVVTRLGFNRHLGIRNIITLRFGEEALSFALASTGGVAVGVLFAATHADRTHKS
jgi:hypothetical protein